MKKILIIMIFVCSFTLIGEINAETKTMCNNCTDAQKGNLAKSLITENYGIVHIGDTDIKTVKSYAVIKYREGFITFKQSNITQTPDYIDDEYALFWQELETIRSKRIDVPEDIADSVWDLIGSNLAQERLFTYFNSQSGFSIFVAKWTNRINNFFGNDPLFDFTLTFKDGSSTVIEFSHIQMDMDGNIDVIYEINWEKSLDADQNEIAMFSDPIQFNFRDGETDNLGEFRDAANRLGINVTFGSSGFRGAQMTCTWSQENKTYTCRVTPR